MKKITLYTIALAGSFTLGSCSDSFLEQQNTTSINQETFFDSNEAIEKAIYPLYNYVWADFNNKFYYGMGDGRANNITAQYSDYIYPYTNLNETALTDGLNDAWNSLYSVVAQSNNVINNIKGYSASNVSEEAKIQGIAQARFMRGVAYWYIASLWGDAIIYTNTSAIINNYATLAPYRQADVMEFAIRDMEYAAKYLNTKSSVTGFVNKYSAYGMLSRMYLSMAGLIKEGQYNGSQDEIVTNFNRGVRNTYYLDLAKKAALKVCDEYDGQLETNYGSLFSTISMSGAAPCYPIEGNANNSSESLFQLHWITGSTDAVGWGCTQQITAFFGWSTSVCDGTNWGGATYCSWDLWCEYDSQDLIRKHFSCAWLNEYYPELNQKNGGYTYGVDDNPGSQGANIKKYVTGTNADNGISYKQSSGINTHMLRLAEVYLNLAEAILGNDASTSDETALKYYNKVRERAGMPTKSSITYEDLRYERRIEFAFEGQYWYDLVRRGYYQQQEVINYMNNQNRNASYYTASTKTYELSENYVAPGAGVSTATEKSMLLPYPATDQAKDPMLSHDNVTPYEFPAREVEESELF
ncbi:MAG: RagB/SusD family nutrient uptake outer membrane protein [Bacteroidaceae bacterium]|nr:RagB/SusD family nutrient uptake outer membrane protein [Bacteroidaceae bacterium]